MQRKAQPLREGVVVIDEGTTMEQLQQLGRRLEERFGIKAMQIHIHRDEGYRNAAVWTPNFHAHIEFDWTRADGRSCNLKSRDMAEVQTITAEVLGMERGVSSDHKHLSAMQYKNLKETERNLSLQQEHDRLLKQVENMDAENQGLKDTNAELLQQKEQMLLELETLKREIRSLKITKKAKNAVLEKVNSVTTLFGKSEVQNRLEESQKELVSARQQILDLQALVSRIREDLERRTKERDASRREMTRYKNKAARTEAELNGKERELEGLKYELTEERKQTLNLRRLAFPRKFDLPDIVDMERSCIVGVPGGRHALKVFLNGADRAMLVNISNQDYERYLQGRVSLHELIGTYCTHEIDVAIARKLDQLEVTARKAMMESVANSMFYGVLHVLNVALSQNAYACSASDGNPNIRHKSKEEILREMIDQGYSVCM
jgi:hypothetical protein